MSRLKYVLGWSGLAALLLAPGLSAEDSIKWLERMDQATREQSYHGAYVYERSGIFTTQNIWRQVEDGKVHERLVQSAGRHQEWVRRDGRLVCATSLSQGRTPQNIPQLNKNPAGLTDWYGLRVLGDTRIASRPVTVISVQPRDAFRYAYELYLDQETGLLLKSLLVDDGRELLERFQFTTISFDNPSNQDLRPGSSCLELAAAEDVPTGDVNFWEPLWLPPGFTLGHRQVQTLKDSDTRIATQIYSDGLARFTLFIEPLGKDSLAEDLRAQLGPTVAVSRRLVAADDLYLATVVGEIPPITAERIAESLSQAVTGAQP
ncbi:MucB/RseB C-terminal domain-containing protein [Halopseudomonas bauzanensis]|uniref:RNA polymerase subunit sigma n=1 Tax=Halopseudomonas bauzanensis TaxID=653930 RepID=A0A4U0YQD9_9GAMM|nr:MucB/RseB C-terminal domain-containing protein [Halopseudomonas bauzanensis]TKA92114.1 RNA polymerase subunit sigma [Halopseudomonas bauzanensis]